MNSEPFKSFEQVSNQESIRKLGSGPEWNCFWFHSLAMSQIQPLENWTFPTRTTQNSPGDELKIRSKRSVGIYPALRGRWKALCPRFCTMAHNQRIFTRRKREISRFAMLTRNDADSETTLSYWTSAWSRAFSVCWRPGHAEHILVKPRLPSRTVLTPNGI